MALEANVPGSATNRTTSDSVSRATTVLSQFDAHPSVAAEVYDAVLQAKRDGTSEKEVLDGFVAKYGIDLDLRARIEQALSKTGSTGTQVVSRATAVVSQFNAQPDVVGEVYDAVLAAKRDGASETDVLDKFVAKYGISDELKSRIVQALGETA